MTYLFISSTNKIHEGNIFNDHEPWIEIDCWGLMTHQPLQVILCRLPEKGRKEIEETVEEMKERDRKKEEQE